MPGPGFARSVRLNEIVGGMFRRYSCDRSATNLHYVCLRPNPLLDSAMTQETPLASAGQASISLATSKRDQCRPGFSHGSCIELLTNL